MFLTRSVFTIFWITTYFVDRCVTTAGNAVNKQLTKLKICTLTATKLT